MGEHAAVKEVVKAAGPMVGRGSFLGPATSRRGKWWDLTLACGHVVQRTVRYRPLGDRAQRGGTQHRSAADVLPGPRRVRCEFCAGAVGPQERR